LTVKLIPQFAEMATPKSKIIYFTLPLNWCQTLSRKVSKNLTAIYGHHQWQTDSSIKKWLIS
jgi:hypothetical protein